MGARSKGAVSFSHVGVVCRDPEVTERFYREHFGFRRARVFRPGPGQIVMLEAGGFYLELFQATAEAPHPPPREAGPSWPCLRHLCFAVADLDAQLARMGADARLTLGPLDMDALVPGMRVCWLADPDGNIVELNQGYADDPRLARPGGGG
jgi:glyoxylase I family protein